MSSTTSGVAVAVSASSGASGKEFPHSRYLEIARPEIIAPLRDTVGLVDNNQADVGLTQTVEKRPGFQLLGRHIDELHLSEHHPVDGKTLLGARHSVVEIEGAHPCGPEIVDLILHQRNQRSHNEGDTVESESRHLKRYRLSATGRHQSEGVAACHDRGHDVGLQGPETVVAPVLLQKPESEVGMVC